MPRPESRPAVGDKGREISRTVRIAKASRVDPGEIVGAKTRRADHHVQAMSKGLKDMVLHHVRGRVVDQHVSGRRQRLGEAGADRDAEPPGAGRLADIPSGRAPCHRADKRQVPSVSDCRDERPADPAGGAGENDATCHGLSFLVFPPRSG